MHSFMIGLVVFPLVAHAIDAATIAANHKLPNYKALPFPSSPLSSSDSAAYLRTNTDWQLTKKGHIAQEEYISFVKDPFTPGSSSAVLAVDYQAGQFGGQGGPGFANYFNDSQSTGFESMLLSYQLAFQKDYDFVLGGKLPGLRGGNISTCSGGVFPNDCFSTRLMWRTDGAGEAYSYIQTPGSTSCTENSGIKCNSDFGTSLGRGTFNFVTEEWQNISMFIALNNPVTASNGQIAVYHNGVQAMSFSNVQIRSNDSAGAVQSITGIFFSTFFGGDNSSWAPPTAQTSYFRNFELWGSNSPSDASGSEPTFLGTPSNTKSSGASKLVAHALGAVLLGMIGIAVTM